MNCETDYNLDKCSTSNHMLYRVDMLFEYVVCLNPERVVFLPRLFTSQIQHVPLPQGYVRDSLFDLYLGISM